MKWSHCPTLSCWCSQLWAELSLSSGEDNQALTRMEMLRWLRAAGRRQKLLRSFKSCIYAPGTWRGIRLHLTLYTIQTFSHSSILYNQTKQTHARISYSGYANQQEQSHFYWADFLHQNLFRTAKRRDRTECPSNSSGLWLCVLDGADAGVVKYYQCIIDWVLVGLVVDLTNYI